MAYALYVTDYGEVSLNEDEAAILAGADFIYQRPGSANGYIEITRRAEQIKARLQAEAKEKWQRSRPAFFWLGAEADNG